MSGTRKIDFQAQEYEHCHICGKALSEDEAIMDEHDEVWCQDCLNEAIRRYEATIEKMKEEKQCVK